MTPAPRTWSRTIPFQVTISVTNIEESGIVTLSSQHPRVGASVTAELDDPDGTPTGVTWQWAGSTDKNDWTDITGETAETYTPLAGDVGDHLRATASYTDPKFGAGKTAEAVTEEVVENSDPVFAVETDSRTVAENTPAGEKVGTPVTATDDDEDIGDVDLLPGWH